MVGSHYKASVARPAGEPIDQPLPGSDPGAWTSTAPFENLKEDPDVLGKECHYLSDQPPFWLFQCRLY